jgi:hypothetical protein
MHHITVGLVKRGEKQKRTVWKLAQNVVAQQLNAWEKSSVIRHL